MTAKVEKVVQVYKGWSTLSKVTLNDGGTRFEREVEDHGQAVGVLPYDPKRRVALLIQTPRTPVLLSGQTEHLLEVPAGLIDDGEPVETSVRREAHEEVGVKLTTLELIGTLWSCPGVSTETIALFLAPYSQGSRTGQGGGLADENESITVVEESLAALARLADAGDLPDMKTFLLVQTLRLRKPDLFR